MSTAGFDPSALRRRPEPPTEPLPAEARAALGAIVAELRNVPRAIIGDPAEVVHFLGRQARRLEAVRAMRVPVPALPAPKPPSAVLMAPAGLPAARAAAEATFGTPARTSPAPEPSTSRVVIGHRGRSVPVVLRRARVAGQLDLPL